MLIVFLPFFLFLVVVVADSVGSRALERSAATIFGLFSKGRRKKEALEKKEGDLTFFFPTYLGQDLPALLLRHRCDDMMYVYTQSVDIYIVSMLSGDRVSSGRPGRRCRG